MSPSIDALDFRVLDAEYSASLERIVAVSTAPQSALHVYDPVGQTDLAIPLSLPPRCVGVSPDGLTAAVGHDAWVTHVDLASGAVLGVHAVPAIAFDIVLSANGWAYVMPLVDQWTTIKCLNLATGQVTNSTGGSVRAATRMAAHPGNTAIYGADNGLSPSDIERYSIVNGTAQVLYDSPYHGDYGMCGDLWITADGLRIVTKCGNTFRSSPVQGEDMTYTGALPGVTGVQYAHHSVQSHTILVIPSGTTNDRRLRFHDEAFLGFAGDVAFPQFPVGAGSAVSHGRFVFHDGSGGRAFAIVQADASSGLVLDSGVATYTFPGGCTGGWSNYCATSPNSAGAGATMSFTGSLSIAANDTWMKATGCPPNAIGAFIFGAQQGLLPFGDGTLCIGAFGSGIRRPFARLRAGPDGIATQHLDFPALPANAPIPAGSTQNFQFWFRDPFGPGGQGFNLTDAASATFCN